MLGYEQATGRVNRKAFGISYPRCIAALWRELLVRFIRVIAPDAATGFQLRTWIVTGYLGLPVLRLAGVGRGGDINIHRAIGADDKRMHGMVSAKRQSRDDRFRSILRHERAGGEQIAYDSVIDLRIDRSLVYSDTRATGSVCLHGFTKALDHVSHSRAGFVLQGYKKSTVMGLTEVVVVP